ncbi:MAG TPA: acetyl-CoA hydrolase/transferase C-terminal domain-containing protein, partial [Pseudomonadales bacterium]|nr:acetyl-CoA hydrolase/transferase C-terminal domain-containing protein [Pseudomonadales bacterium]
TLVPDGGTLQIGIGSLGDAIAFAIQTRDQKNTEYRAMVRDLSAGQFDANAHLDSFTQGLYGCSEMFVNGFMQLIKTGIIRREVYDDLNIQRLLNAGRINATITPHTLDVLLEEEAIHARLTEKDVAFLKKFGIFKDDVTLEDGLLHHNGHTASANLTDHTSRVHINKHFLGERLANGVYMHAGFFIGPRDFYQALRDMPEHELNKICMSKISKINQLYGHQELAVIQRLDARFMNTTMMVSLLGAATSDCLDSGNLVSGVGGQYNFVSMAHALPGARSILMLRATRESGGNVTSNIVWNYGHVTIPRHLRDIVITEYGIADLRGQSDSEVIKRMIAIADSRFQQELAATAKANGKLQQDYEIPAHQRHNTPDILKQRLDKWKAFMPDFPFGTDFTEDELTIVRALQKLKAASEHPLELIKQIFSNLFEEKEVPAKYLERMKLDNPDSLKLKLARKLFVGNL